MIREAIIRRIVERDLAGTSLLEDDVSRDEELLPAAAIDIHSTARCRIRPVTN